MVDRIGKISPPDHVRIEESKDATDDEGRRGGDGQDEEGSEGLPDDGFDRLQDRTDWKILLDHPQAQQKRVEVGVDDIAELKFLHANLKTNPSLLNLRVKLKDGSSFPSAYFSIARHMALSFQHSRYDSAVEAEDLTDGATLTFFVPDVRSDSADEVTRVTEPVERTFSQTVKLLMKKTLLQKMGVQDPDTRHANPEIVWAYATAAVVVASLAFAAWWIMR